jgi:hypothetical protein
MKISINNLRTSLNNDMSDLIQSAAKKLNISSDDFANFRITKESIDARRKPNISLVYSVLVEVDGSIKIPNSVDIKIIDDKAEDPLMPGGRNLIGRPVIAGFGPAGMFAGLILAQHGYKPLIVERGENVDKRTEMVMDFWNKRQLSLETNVQFGEGGAGTFSDGKLTTRINDRRCDKVLEEFAISGAHKEILYKYRPHIGSDVLKKVVVNIRKRIQDLGGEISFNTKLTSLKITNSKISGVVLNGSSEVDTNIVILAVGHSARDTFEMLYESGIVFEQKPFSIGVRIEHPQDIINKAQFGMAASHPRLGAADYQLFYKTSGRTVYSFCMCPGGVVVASASEENSIVTNGMSEYARDRENANSALVVSVEPGDYGSSHPLAGISFQRKWEKLAFEIGGKDYSAPIQLLGDFLDGRSSTIIGKINPSYTGSVKPSDLNLCLPSYVTSLMKESIGYFDKKITGFGTRDAVLTGVETRTSSPVRIPRTDSFEAIGLSGLYPAGEGAGYAGGIISAAVDGVRIAEQIIKTYAQPV